MKQNSFNHQLPILEVSAGCIVSKRGDLTVGITLDKPEIFTLGEKEYVQLHEAFVKAMKVLPPGMVVHMQDSYIWRGWKSSEKPGNSFLGAASDRFFDKRPWLDHSCNIYLTWPPANRAAVTSASSSLLKKWIVPPDTLSPETLAMLNERADQFCRVLQETMINTRRLTTEELASQPDQAGLIERYCYLLYDSTPILRDIDFTNGLKIGSSQAMLYSLADAEHLPARCSPCKPFEPYSSAQTKLPIGLAARLHLLLHCHHIVNLYFVIADQQATTKRIERLRLRMQSLSKYSRSNAYTRQAADDFLTEMMAEQLTPVRMHLNVMAFTENPKEQLAISGSLISAILSMDAKPHEETVGAPQLWWAGIPGNAGDLPDNECFDTFLEKACCFINYETNYRDSSSPYAIRFGDRLTGRPVHVDIEVEARKKGLIQNGNLFILSGSGAGKSYLMNHLCRTYKELGMHLLIVDDGHSYRGLCHSQKGYYFTYEEDHPLQFNPFLLSPGEKLDTEKRESLKSLLLALWKRSDEAQLRSEYVALSNALQAYYDRPDQNKLACFDTFYEFVRDEYSETLHRQGTRQKEFDLDNFLFVLRPYYRGGEFDFLLNAPANLDLLNQPLIVFELGNIKNHPILFPVVTLVIVEVFLTKMRNLKGVRKMLVIEEAWKAIIHAGMAEHIREWAKTLRKHLAKLAVVSQEIGDIADSPIVKDAIIANSDCRILLDQSKFQNRFDQIQALLGITDKQKAEILSINKGHGPGRVYKDLWIGLGPLHSKVYRLETSWEEYFTYTSAQDEKLKVEKYTQQYGSYEKAIENLAEEARRQATT